MELAPPGGGFSPQGNPRPKPAGRPHRFGAPFGALCPPPGEANPKSKRKPNFFRDSPTCWLSPPGRFFKLFGFWPPPWEPFPPLRAPRFFVFFIILRVKDFAPTLFFGPVPARLQPESTLLRQPRRFFEPRKSPRVVVWPPAPSPSPAPTFPGRRLLFSVPPLFFASSAPFPHGDHVSPGETTPFCGPGTGGSRP